MEWIEIITLIVPLLLAFIFSTSALLNIFNKNSLESWASKITYSILIIYALLCMIYFLVKTNYK